MLFPVCTRIALAKMPDRQERGLSTRPALIGISFREALQIMVDLAQTEVGRSLNRTLPVPI